MVWRSGFLLCCVAVGICAVVSEKEEDRPYEFAFNIIDFQHRYEKKDTDGIITGEYGFITADGVYHETGYATDKNGDFIITRMRNRKITSLEDAQEIFKDRPEAAEKLVKAVAKACSGCKIPAKQGKPAEPGKNVTTVTESTIQKKVGPILKEITKTLPDRIKIENRARARSDTSEKTASQSTDEKRVAKETGTPARKFSEREPEVKSAPIPNDSVLEKIANDLYYRFNYSITSHDHQETGYRSGRKDGSYRAQSENGVDTRVKYLSNEFGHQPNITFIPKLNKTDEAQALKGYSFLWYWQ